MGMQLEFAGEWFDLSPDETVLIGREGLLEIDDNPYLHRRFLEVSRFEDMWWLTNVGSRLSATVADPAGNTQAWLAPGARLPVVYPRTTILFTAGPTTYELTLVNDEPTFLPTRPAEEVELGETTIGPVSLTESQRLLVLALAEPVLSGRGSTATIPSSAEAARRLGWAMTRFNRKLDNVCEKLDRYGVRGLHGAPGKLAVNRRARLVEYAVASRLVQPQELPLLDAAADTADD
ncbi:MAG: FHA domain-containing protein [Georgenia sp.]